MTTRHLIFVVCRWPGIFVRLRRWFTESIVCFAQHYKSDFNGKCLH